MNDWFAIPDMDQFTEKVRIIVYNNFGKWNEENDFDNLMDTVNDSEIEDLNKLLSQEESLLIVKELVKTEINKKTKQTRFVINDDIFLEIIENLNNRLVSNVLQSLVQKGLIESSFDSSSNDFVFWIKDNDENKPETD